MAPFNLLVTQSHRYRLQYVIVWRAVHVDLLHEWNAIKILFILLKDLIKSDAFNIYLN